MNCVKLTGMILILVTVTGIISGCIKTENGTGNRINITDMSGRTVEIPKKVERVVGIEAGALRLIVYLQATDKVVGVEDFEQRDNHRPYILAHPELADLSPIGPIHGGEAELITSMQPDVIFWTYAEAGEAHDLQEKTGIPVIVISYGDLDDERDTFYGALRLIAKVLDKEKRAEELIDYIDGTIQDLNDRTRNIPDQDKPTCYVGGIGYRGSHGIVSTETNYGPFLFVNVKNVASGLGTAHAFVDPEALIQWDPDVIFADEGGISLIEQDFTNNTAYQTMKAVKSGDIYGVLPYNYYSTNYGTVLSDAYYIGKVLYPDAFADIDPKDKADEIYRTLVGKGVYVDMEEIFGGFKEFQIEG